MREEIQHDLGMIRKALAMIEDRSFSIMQNLDATGKPSPWKLSTNSREPTRSWAIW